MTDTLMMQEMETVAAPMTDMEKGIVAGAGAALYVVAIACIIAC